ncbi:YIP1 family protein [Antarctobacter jejuensis]|uniref:YIP1 family protein n=1 Tax=Antarctobacter jejuensis TaxID=1439938 RepID=UPI003FD10A5F
MTIDGYLKLALQSVTNPREVAALLLSIRPNREALLTAFGLVVVVNTLVFSSSVLLAPGTVPAFLASPMVFLAMQAVVLAGSILGFTGVGRIMGGRGRLEEVALLMIWMQGLRVLVQIALLILTPLSPGLAGLATMAATALGVWILINFLNEVHELGSLIKAVAVMILGVLAMAFALSLLLAFAGVTPEGMTDYV